MSFPWTFGAPPPPKQETPREKMLRRLREGVPFELVMRAGGFVGIDFTEDKEVDAAIAEGEIVLFERARDSGVSGAIRAAMRQEAKTWQPKADVATGQTLEDLLRE